MSGEPTPHEARGLGADGDPSALRARVDRAGLDANGVRRLLRAREGAPAPEPGTRLEPLTDVDGRTTDMAVHVPEGADPGTLGALVLLHGVGGSGPATLPRFTELARRANVAILAPTARAVRDRSNQLDLAGLFGNRFDAPSWDLRGADFPLAALRWARVTLGVDPDRCLFAGTSMGALATWNLAMRYGDRLCAAVPINGALSMWETFGTDRRKRALLPNVLTLPLFVVHGAEDTQIPPAFDRQSVATLRESGHPALRHVEVPGGGHALETLNLADGAAPLLGELADWLAGRRRPGPAARITHRALDDRHGRSRWVAVRGVAPGAVAEVRAERLAADAVRVTVTGAREVRLHLGSDLFAPGEVAVSVNGVAHTVEFRPSLDRLLASYRAEADPALLDEQTVTLPVPAAGDGPDASRTGEER
ncbi:hypothetical protein [Streptomyces sedi]|uniref:Phospholipase/carboxylesterase/thioesterase domain-containing protein n=1 Tax=Streptomyces sedi TaxID=555059 RepID=A0A5C4V9K8_9ACTN|nr:hypothetical protein [Streptomyces sedi]TNM32245.1 hypothetical protein FH715_07585 [Streptomyces sedi]